MHGGRFNDQIVTPFHEIHDAEPRTTGNHGTSKRAEKAAINAVMAGCKPEYFPLVLLALEALAEEPYNLYGTQATTHPCTPMLIFNGPIASEVGINAGQNAIATEAIEIVHDGIQVV